MNEKLITMAKELYVKKAELKVLKAELSLAYAVDKLEQDKRKVSYVEVKT